MASFQNFCNVTSLHGFKDLYDAKQGFKLLWLSLIIAGLAMTCFQIIQVSHGYLEAPTATKLQFKTLSKYKLPNIVICPAKWVEETKRKLLPLSEDGMIYAFSLLYDVSQRWNRTKVNMVSKEFYNFLHENNYSLDSFYMSLMMEPDRIFKFSSLSLINKDVKPNYRKQYGGSGHFCFVLKFTEMRELSLMYEPFTFRINYDHQQPAANWYENSSDGVTYPSFLISPDHKIRHSPEHLELRPNVVYSVGIRALYMVRVPTSKYSCYSTKEMENNEMYSRTFCQYECLEKLVMATNCTPCHNFGLSDTVSLSNPNTFPMCTWLDGSAGLFMSNTCIALAVRYGLPKSCILSCPPPCEQWRYEMNVVTVAKWLENKTVVKVLFNPADDIMHSEEILTYSWELFVSNIGGQLGLWMGGSLISMIQAVYYIVLWLIEKNLTRSLKISMSFRNNHQITSANVQPFHCYQNFRLSVYQQKH